MILIFDTTKCLNKLIYNLANWLFCVSNTKHAKTVGQVKVKKHELCNNCILLAISVISIYQRNFYLKKKTIVWLKKLFIGPQDTGSFPVDQVWFSEPTRGGS